ncbi:MAG: hypothetical protein R3B93_01540 [Bacteroidia bacterium]
MVVKVLEGDKSVLSPNKNQKKILSRFGWLELGLDHPLCVRLYGFGISPYLQELSCHAGQEEVYDTGASTVGEVSSDFGFCQTN